MATLPRQGIERTFLDQFGEVPAVIASAPGRVNVIGEHVDYNQGMVLPMAIEMRTIVAGRQRDGGSLRVWSEQERGLVVWSDLSQADSTTCPSGWFRYVAGVLTQLVRHRRWSQGLDLVIDSNLPSGAGLSSSAALTVAVLSAAMKLMGGTVDAWTAARWCQAAEHEFAGVPCGLMDPLAIIAARARHLLLIDLETETVEPVPFAADGVAWITVSTGVRHALAMGAYAARRAECEAAAHALGVNSLRQLTLDQIQQAGRDLPGVWRRRARHVVTEIDRVRRAAICCRQRDWPQLGNLLNESHESLARDYEVSCPELDILAGLLQAHPRVYGARLTGGGFGGCAIALVDRAAWRDVVERVGADYYAATHLPWQAWLTDPSPGAQHEGQEVFC